MYILSLFPRYTRRCAAAGSHHRFPVACGSVPELFLLPILHDFLVARPRTPRLMKKRPSFVFILRALIVTSMRLDHFYLGLDRFFLFFALLPHSHGRPFLSSRVFCALRSPAVADLLKPWYNRLDHVSWTATLSPRPGKGPLVICSFYWSLQ